MLLKLFNLVNHGLLLAVVWLGLTMIFILPKTSGNWIPFWIVIGLGLIGTWASARQWQAAPSVRRHRLAAWLASIPCLFFGAGIVIANEVQARRNGEWEGYITILGGILVTHAVLWILLLSRAARSKT